MGRIHITSGKDKHSSQYVQINWQLLDDFTFIYDFLTMKRYKDVRYHNIVCQQSHEKSGC